MTSSHLPENPHDATLWPRDVITCPHLATATEALSAAGTLLRLLSNDTLLRAFRRDADTPADEAPSFNDATVDGLQRAIRVCVDRATLAVEALGDREGAA